MDMNIRLKGKYRREGAPGVIGYPAKARTNNSHHPVADKIPANEPCKRANAGFKGVWHPNAREVRKVMLVTFGGKKRMVTEAVAEAALKFDAEGAISKAGLV